MNRKPQPRYIVSPYNAAEAYDRLTHPERFSKPAIYFGELLSFADPSWAQWYAERRGWFVFGNYMFEQPELIDAPIINIDGRCSKDTVAQVFSTVIDDEGCQKLVATCIVEKMSPESYMEMIPPCKERRRG